MVSVEKETIMKFMVTWRLHQDKRMEVWKKFSSMTPQERADVGQGVKLIGRWPDGSRQTAATVFSPPGGRVEMNSKARGLSRW